MCVNRCSLRSIFCAQDYGLSTSHSCSKCPADIHNHPYTHVHAGASWICRCYTEAQFKRAFPAACEPFDLPGVNHHTIAPDTMHNKHLGMDVYYLASVLYLLVFVVLPGVDGGWRILEIRNSSGRKHFQSPNLKKLYISLYIYIYISPTHTDTHTYTYT